jgi:osmotically inducible protein OsmC
MKTTSILDEVTTARQAKVLYTAKAHTTGGRQGGASRTSDGRLDVMLSIPGAPGDGTNPEQLLAVGWSACFTSAMKIAAAKMKVTLPPGMSLDAEVDLGSDEDGYFLQARLKANLPGLDRQVAQAILESAHQTCPYSKATRGNINVELNAQTERTL